MTATEVLRRMLDERGLFWIDIPRADFKRTCWKSSDEQAGYFYYDEYDSGVTNLEASHLTPAQAIAATLGRGECHITVQDDLDETEGMGDVWLECDACHWQMPLEPSTPRFNFCPNCGRRIVGPTTNGADAEVTND